MKAALQLGGMTVELLAEKLAATGHAKYSAKTLYSMQNGNKGKRVISPQEGRMIADACGISRAFFTVDFTDLDEPAERDALAQRLEALEGQVRKIAEHTLTPENVASVFRRHEADLDRASNPGTSRS